MKKINRAILIAIATILMTSVPSFALKIGLPDIEYDSARPGGLNTSNAITKEFRLESGVVVNRVDGTTEDHISDWLFSISTVLDGIGEVGPFTRASFKGGSIELKDKITDTTLLSGDIKSFFLDGWTGGSIAAGAAIVTGLTGSFLDTYNWPGGSANPIDGGIVHLEFNIPGGGFAKGLFDSSFAAEGKGDFGPVPEPGTMILLGFGLIGIARLSRRAVKS